MKIDSLKERVFKSNWTLSDNFRIEIDPQIGKIDQDIWNAALVSIQLPELSAGETDNVVGGEHRINSKLQDLFRFTLTFRDLDEYKIRRYWEQKFILQQRMYYDDIKTYIAVYYTEADVDLLGYKVFESEGLITNISGITFSNAESGFQEFTVSFSSYKYSTDDFNNFGSDNFFTEYLDKTLK